MRQRAAEDKAARFDARHFVDLAAGPGLHQFVDGAAEGAGVAQKRRDIAEHDARLRIVRDGADRSLQVVFQSHTGHVRKPHILQEFPTTIPGDTFASRENAGKIKPRLMWRTMTGNATGVPYRQVADTARKSAS